MLENKKFLFVEDDIGSITYYRKGLLSSGVESHNIVVVETMEQAIREIEKSVFDFIFIDLYCAPVCPELKPYERILGKPEFNHGQLLGLWLDDNYPETRYGYITQIPTLTKQVNETQSAKPLFNKNQLTSVDFVEKVKKLL